MRTEEKVYYADCPCDKQVRLEKRMNVQVVAKKRQAQEPVLIDVFCHGCGVYVKVPLDGNFAPLNDLRE